MDKIAAFFQRKIGGIKVLYIAVVLVAGALAYVWFSGRTGRAIDAVEPSDAAPVDAPGVTGDYAELATGTGGNVPLSGTIVQVPQESQAVELGEDSNNAWKERAISWLVQNNRATTLQAQIAIDRYLEGSSLSYQESQLINLVTSQPSIGLPPNQGSMSGVSVAGAKPPAPRSAPTISGVNSKGFTVTSATPATSVPIIGYVFQVATNSSFTNNVFTRSDVTRKREFVARTPATKHWIRTAAKTAAGQGPWSTATTATTSKAK